MGEICKQLENRTLTEMITEVIIKPRCVIESAGGDCKKPDAQVAFQTK